ncbi:uncharacterized protein METZ01_LOCUS268585, partial [marine metagenome]
MTALTALSLVFVLSNCASSASVNSSLPAILAAYFASPWQLDATTASCSNFACRFEMCTAAPTLAASESRAARVPREAPILRIQDGN